eukprot:XP_019918264.1 PREDICTED: uncharacterized protein LOC109617231 [Crassostrea gigas]
MKPSEIYYSQDSIKEKFDKGHTIYSTLSVCKKHQYVIKKIPPMRVCKKDGKWYTLDNRRLWVFRKLEADGHIKDVKVIQGESLNKNRKRVVVMEKMSRFLNTHNRRLANSNTYSAVRGCKLSRCQIILTDYIDIHICDAPAFFQFFENPQSAIVQSVPSSVFHTDPYCWNLTYRHRVLFTRSESRMYGLAIVKGTSDRILAEVNLGRLHC